MAYSFNSSIPPAPPEEADRARMEHGRLRRRLLTGAWRQDLEQFMAREIDATRRLTWGNVDVTKNVFRSVVHQLAVLFDTEPVISHDTSQAAATLDPFIQKSGLWEMCRTLQIYTVGQRESLIRLDAVVASAQGGEPRVQVRVVPADLVYGHGSHEEPDTPVYLCEYRQRKTDAKGTEKQGGFEWTKDEFSIEDPENPFYRVLTGDGEEDLSEQFLGSKGGLSGDAYPYRYQNGAPFIPYTLFHAERSGSGSLFSPYEGAELVEGSLVVAVLWSFWKKCVKDNSWPQRWCIGVRPAGGYKTQDNIAYISTDPSSLLNFEATTDKAPQIGQFDPASDPTALGESIRQYSSDLALDFGISATDVARVSANPRSGYAIALSKEGVRAAQRRAEPAARRGVVELLGKFAAMVNILTGAGLPEDNWAVFFPGVPLSSEEKKQRIEEWSKQAELGVASPVDLYMAINSVTREVALEALQRISQERRQFMAV